MTILEPAYAWAYSLTPRSSTTHLILHHFAGSGYTPEATHRMHLDKGWAGIAYHYYVRKDGSVCRGRPEEMMGGHCTGMNSCSIGICFEGNFETETMGEQQLAAGRELVSDIADRYPGIIIGAHRDYGATACPGASFPIQELKDGDNMTQETFNAMINTYLAELSAAEPSDWSAEARQWAESAGIIYGNENGEKQYKKFCTREEMVQFLKRMWDKANG